MLLDFYLYLQADKVTFINIKHLNDIIIVVERKLAERKDPVDEKDRSTSWKLGIFFYSVAITLVYTANVYFFALVKDDSEY